MTISGRNISLEDARQLSSERFASTRPGSAKAFAAACRSMPGGNTRSVLFYEPFPLAINRGEGARLWDVDGHEYTDFLGEYTAGLYGHSSPQINAALKAVLDEGILRGGPTPYEAELADLVTSRFPSCDLVRFTNSGTEGNLMAIAAARVHTGRTHLMAFEGGYHGGVLHFAHGPNPVNAPYPVVMAPYNDAQATLDLIERHANELAAVIVEPLQGTSGAIPAEPEFLRAIREATQRLGIVLIFDEVMTSRLGPGGLQQALDVTPDMTSFGKFIGGGMTFGAFGGRSDIMSRFDPRSPQALPHAGTFNNNVLTMSAGVVGLRDLYPANVARELTARGERFKADLNALIDRYSFNAQVTGTGSILAVHFTRDEIRCAADAQAAHPAARPLFHLDMLERGFYQSKIGLMSLSLPLTEDDYSAFIAAFEQFMNEYAPLYEAAVAA